MLLKDDVLQKKVKNGLNVAKFISFAPGENLSIRHCCINSYELSEEQKKLTPEQLVKLLFEEAEKLVSVRTFKIGQESGNPVFFDQNNLDIVLDIVNKHTKMGYYVIVNEGLHFINSEVSGVMFGSLIEFAPAQSPRCVEKKGATCVLPVKLGLNILKRIYQILTLDKFNPHQRVEFSIYPYKCGVYSQNTIIWEVSEFDENDPNIPVEIPKIIWPNPFSRVLGDKVFGLLVCNFMNYLVPKTIVLNKYFIPFTFGTSIKDNGIEYWCRSCPGERLPGQLPSVNKNFNVFDLMRQAEKLVEKESYIPSLIVQEGVKSIYSGSVITTRDGEIVIEGVKGRGDEFMLGNKVSEFLPSDVIKLVEATSQSIIDHSFISNEIEFEWVYDGKHLWIVQLSVGKNMVSRSIVVEGAVNEYLKFDPSKSASALTDLAEVIRKAKEINAGISIIGNVGRTSHIVHLLIKEQIPSIIEE